MSRPLLLGLLLLTLIAGIWALRRYLHVYHFATVQPGILYRDGVHSDAEFRAAVRKARPRTIVALVDDREIVHQPFTDELAYCRSAGIEVIRVPIELGGWPTTEQVRQFLSIVADPARQPVLVHCAQGVRRTGMMVAAYQESVLHLAPDQAKAAILSFGHSDRTVNDVKRFIEVYDAKDRQMTQTPEMSRE